MSAATTSTPTPAPPQRPLLRRPVFWILVGLGWVALILSITGAILATRPAANAVIPPDWHLAATPQNGAFSSYAISSSTPGLIVAVIGQLPPGATGYPPGPGALWRFTDGGVNWSKLPTFAGLDANTEVAWIPGSGPLIAADLAATPQRLYVSHDIGISWTVIATPMKGGAKILYDDLVITSYWRHGRLYSQFQQFDTSGVTSAFSVSADDGATWTTLEAAPLTSRTGPATVTAISPDERDAHAWFRLISSPLQAASGTPYQVEHSSDDGQTWSVVATPTSPVPAPGSALFSFPYTAATLRTTPGAPNVLCLALAFGVPSATSARLTRDSTLPDAIASAAPPFIGAVYLERSRDGGQTWTTARVDDGAHGFTAAMAPGVMLDDAGSCWLGMSDESAYLTNTNYTAPGIAIWKLGPDTTSATRVAVLPHFRGESAQITSGESPRIIVLAREIPQQMPCFLLCLTDHPAQPPLRLLWHSIS